MNTDLDYASWGPEHNGKHDVTEEEEFKRQQKKQNGTGRKFYIGSVAKEIIRRKYTFLMKL